MKTVIKTCLILFTALLIAGCAQKEENDNKLQTPYSLKVSSDNVLTWSIVKGAAAYIPNINGEDCEEVTTNQLALSDVVEGGHLVIKIKAIGDGVTWLDSDWSEELEYDMAVALDSPLPVASGKTVSWEAVEGASKYEYNINGSLVLTEETVIDLSGYLAERYTITVRALPNDNKLNTTSAWSSEIVVAIFDRLATPALVVEQPSFRNPAATTISWGAVEGASGYEVYVDNIKQECEGTTLDFTGKSGSFKVKVTAVNPGIYDSSETAEATITLNDYGKGTESEPYKIYTASDWNDFSDLVTNNEGKAGFQDKFIELAADIDFENTYVKPAGKSAQMSFKGTLDGKDYTLKNAKIGDGTASHQAFFYLLNGTVKNLKFDNITVTGGNANSAASSAAVLSAGNSSVAFTIENCHITNSTVISGPEQGTAGGSYAGGFVGRCNNASVVIRNCSILNSTITASNENAGGIVSLIGAGIIDNASAVGNTIKTETKGVAGGVVGFITGTATIINISSLNNICIANNPTSGGAGGVVGNCNSNDAKMINIYSAGNQMKTLAHSYTLYLGGVLGGNGTVYSALLANCLVESASVDYVYTAASDKPYAACVGIIAGYPNITWDNCIYNQTLRNRYDVQFTSAAQNDSEAKSYYRYAVGQKRNIITNASWAGVDKVSNVTCSTYASAGLTDGTALKQLNDWVETNKSTYPSLKTWTTDENGYPKL
ncbi:MAG: hypothetical protein E7123_07615 [Bacteroidales bacterium]|nr:hypothetical protein [Bacteroidales bacterium]